MKHQHKRKVKRKVKTPPLVCTKCGLPNQRMVFNDMMVVHRGKYKLISLCCECARASVKQLVDHCYEGLMFDMVLEKLTLHSPLAKPVG